MKTLVLKTWRLPGIPITRKRYDIQDVKRGRYITAEAAMTIKMIDAKGGQIYASMDFSGSFDSRNAEMGRDGQRYATPSEKLPTKGQKLEELLQAGAQKFINQISQHKIIRKVQLISRSPFSEKGIKYAKRSLLPEAIEQFELAVSSEDPNDGALYNKGVMLEILGRFDDAYEAFKKAYIISEEDLYLDAMERVNKERAFSLD